MSGYEVVGSPSYPTPNYGAFGDTIGNLANTYRSGQQQNQQRDIATAFKDGIPTDPVTGAPDYNKIMQILAQKGDIGAISSLAGPALDQSQLKQAQTVSPMLSGGPAAAPGGPPASAGPALAPPRQPNPQPSPVPVTNVAAPGGAQLGDLSGAAQAFPSVQAMVSSAVPDASKAGPVAANLAKAMKVDPAAPMTQDQAAQAQRILGAYVQRNGGGATLGARNNNPDNIENGQYAERQPGYAGAGEGGRFAKFATPEAGLDAAANLLDAYGKSGVNTIAGITAKWAPASEKGNDPQAYAETVAKSLGVGPNDPIDLSKPDARRAIASAMSNVESPGAVSPGGGNLPPASAAAAISTRPPGNQVADNSAKPIGPQVPLPQGFTDPQQAILAIDKEMARLSTNPKAAGQVEALKDWRDRIAGSSGLMEVKPGETLLDPRTGQVAFQANTGLLDGETISQMAQQYRSGDTSVMQNLGRGAQGAENIVRLRREIALQNQAAGTTGGDQAMSNAEFQGTKAGERTLGTRQANIELAATEFKNVVPVVQKASAAVSRGNYPDLNRIIQFGEEKTGDPAVVAFGSGVNTLVNLYARAISPTGTPTVSDKDHARDILSKAWSQGQFDAAVGMMSKEIDAALNSPAQVRKEMRERFGGGDQTPDSASPTDTKPAASANGLPPGWSVTVK